MLAVTEWPHKTQLFALSNSGMIEGNHERTRARRSPLDAKERC